MAKYFENIPSVEYSLNLNNVETSINVKSINTKVSFTDLTKQTVDNFYPYSIQTGDRVDTISDFYYETPDRFWIVLLSNDAMDMYYDFSLQESTHNRYLIKKYKAEAIANGYSGTDQSVLQYLNDTTYQYLDSDGFVIDLSTYNSLSPLERSVKTLYEYEWELNESKKEILLASNVYVRNIERQFKDLMKDRG